MVLGVQFGLVGVHRGTDGGDGVHGGFCGVLPGGAAVGGGDRSGVGEGVTRVAAEDGVGIGDGDHVIGGNLALDGVGTAIGDVCQLPIHLYGVPIVPQAVLHGYPGQGGVAGVGHLNGVGQLVTHGDLTAGVVAAVDLGQRFVHGERGHRFRCDLHRNLIVRSLPVGQVVSGNLHLVGQRTRLSGSIGVGDGQRLARLHLRDVILAAILI